MDAEVDIGIIQKVKGVLGIQEDMSSLDLISELRKYWKQTHPDKFSEETAKKVAEEKFKYIGDLLASLEKYIENERINLPAKEILAYEPLYEKITLERKLDAALDEIKSLNEEIVTLKDNNLELQKVIQLKADEALAEEADELRKIYKPSSHKLLSLGVASLLTLALAIMAKLESVYAVIKKYSPIAGHYIDSALFVVLIGTLLMVLKQWIEGRLIIRRIEEVCSALSCKMFLDYLEKKKVWEKDKAKLFSESDVFLFVQGNNGRWKKFLSTLGFRMFQVGTQERLKNYFINTMLNKKLIEMRNANNLDRVFFIVDGNRYYYF